LLNKSISPSKAAKYAHYHKLGFPLVAYDEEGLAPFNADEYLKRRVSDEALASVDYFFAWGEWQKGVIAQKAAEHLHKVLPVGHPRVDLTRREVRGFYEDQVHALRAQYVDFVLINTNFSFYNHFRGRDIEAFLQLKTKAGKVVDEEQRNYYRRVSEHKKALFYAFAEMAARIRERFPDMTVIVRPHPSEDHEYWRQTLPDDDRIQVVHEGTVLPWILASRVMMHNSCTTGIEGYLLEQPVLAYRPVRQDDLDIFLPNALSTQVFSSDELLQQLDAIFSQKRRAEDAAVDAEKRRIAAQYLVGLEGPLSCERIVAYLQQIRIPSKTLFMRSYQSYITLKRLKAALYKRFAPSAARPGEKHEERRQYLLQKFPGLEVAEVQALIANFQRATGRFAEVQVRRLEKNVLQISRQA
jgi:surface carbohydrate biosynthesis protein